eukprot:SAG31_NODE_1575_length_7841_cov_3.083958_6_plen_300_part_00
MAKQRPTARISHQFRAGSSLKPAVPIPLEATRWPGCSLHQLRNRHRGGTPRTHFKPENAGALSNRPAHAFGCAPEQSPTLAGTVAPSTTWSRTSSPSTAEKTREIIHMWASQVNESAHNAYRFKMPKTKRLGHTRTRNRRIMLAVGEQTRGPTEMHKRALAELEIESCITDAMMRQHENKRARKSINQKAAIAKDGRRSKRGRELASLKAAERRDAARGERYEHAISAHAMARSSVRPSSQPGQGRCSPTRTTRASSAAAAATAAANATSQSNGAKERCPHCKRMFKSLSRHKRCKAQL